MEGGPAGVRHQPAVASGLRGEHGWHIFRKHFCECQRDWEFMLIRFSHGFEPHGLLCRIETDEREGFAAIQLLEVFQSPAKRTDYRSYPILEIAQPADSAERLWILTRHPIGCSQIAGFEDAVLVLECVRNCMVYREPIHSFR